jgi:hypothetical protein
MANYKVNFEIELEANTPLEAAKLFNEWIQDQYFIAIVQDEADKIYSVDLGEDDEDAVCDYDDYEPLISSKV